MYKVLIVDDEPFILEGLKRIIAWEEHGLEIAGMFYAGEEALSFHRQHHVHIVVTDIRMPGMNGLDFIRMMKADNPDIKCIILSGYDDFDYVKQALQLGIENYLLKPVSKVEFSQTVLSAVKKIESKLYRDRTEREGINTIREIILYRWVTDTIGAGELERRADMLNIDMSCPCYAVAAAQLLPEGAVPKIKDRNLLIFAINNMCNEILAQAEVGESFCDMDGDVIFLFSLDNPEDYPERVQGLTQQCVSAIHTYMHVHVFIMLGRPVDNFRKVHESYASAKELEEYGLFMPVNSVMTHEEARRINEAAEKDMEIDFARFNQLLLNKDRQGLHDYIDRIYGTLRERDGVTPGLVQNLTFELLIQLSQAVKNIHKRKDIPFADYHNLFSGIFELRRMEELTDWLKMLIGRTIDYLNTEDDNANPLIQELLHYLQENYMENLSLQGLADKFHVNAAYLGQLFKNETGEMFSNYLNQIRVGQAKRYLLESNLKLSEIYEKVGYVNQVYFSRIFKKVAGVSPSDFRELKH